MTELINSIQELFKGLSNTSKLLAIFAILLAGLAYTWINTPDEIDTGVNITTGNKSNTGGTNQSIGGETINIK